MSEPSLDPLGAQLRALAPVVDMPASRSLFERERIAARAPARRWLLPAAVIALLVAGVVGVWALARDSGGSVPADLVEWNGTEFELLAVSPTNRSPGTIQFATTPDELEAVLAPLTDASIDINVELDDRLLVVFNVDGLCSADLAPFQVDGEIWTLQFGAIRFVNCEGTFAYVVAIDRSALGDRAEFRFPESVGGATAAISFDGSTTEPDIGFEMIAVEETALPFGTIRVAESDEGFGTWWENDVPSTERPEVDFSSSFVASFTLPDDACPDILVRFRRTPSAGGVAWTPEFEPPAGGCDQPLITRTYVVRLDRPATPTRVTFRLPGDDVYEYSSSEVTVDVEGAGDNVASGGNEIDITPLDVSVSVPPIGEPRLEAGPFGIAWVVQHDDGSVSVLDAVVDRPTDEDEGGVSGLADLVRPTDDRLGFIGGRWVWDEFGRTLNGPRTDDLVGYEGRVVDGEVELFRSDRSRFDGEPLDAFDPTSSSVSLDEIPLLELDILPTLSFSGPIWRQLDATLVIENGVGRLCEVDGTRSVPDLATCDDPAVETTITSSRPEITSWFFGPVLAEFDELGTIVTVAPLGGSTSRNDGPDGVGSDRGWREIELPDGLPTEATPQLIDDADELAAIGADADAVVVILDVAGNDCRPTLANVTVDDDVVKVRFTPGGVECGESSNSHRFAIEIGRGQLGDQFTLEAPEEIGGPARATVFERAGARTSATSAGSQAEPGGDFDVLWVGPSTLPFGTLAVADNADSWMAWLAQANAGIEGPQPIDFERSIAVAISIPDDACPPDLVGFNAVDGALEPTFVEPTEACRLPLVSRTYVVAVDRSSIIDAAAFRLPADETYEYGQVVVRLPDETAGAGSTPTSITRRGRPGDAAVDALAVVVETVETACGVGLTPVLSASLLARQTIGVVVEIVGGYQLRGRATTTLRAAASTTLEVPLEGMLDAGQQVVVRSARSDAVLTRLSYVGCG